LINIITPLATTLNIETSEILQTPTLATDSKKVAIVAKYQEYILDPRGRVIWGYGMRETPVISCFVNALEKGASL